MQAIPSNAILSPVHNFSSSLSAIVSNRPRAEYSPYNGIRCAVIHGLRALLPFQTVESTTMDTISLVYRLR